MTRRRLRGIRRTRSIYLFGIAGWHALESKRAERRRLGSIYGPKADAWGYETDPENLDRWEAALSMLDRWSVGSTGRALEVGCAEGQFTDQLAPRCTEVLAIDVSAAGLERAKARLSDVSNVEFAEWDVAGDGPPGEFELVTCMDVVNEIRRPPAKRKAITNIAASVAPGGHLLVSEVIQHPVMERAAWSEWLGSAGGWVIDRFWAQTPLSHRETQLVGKHVVSIFNRTH